MSLRITKNYIPVYTSAEIMEDCHPELLGRVQGQVDRLIELQELWNILDGRCLSLAKASNDTDYAAEEDAICELQYLLKYLDEMPVETMCGSMI